MRDQGLDDSQIGTASRLFLLGGFQSWTTTAIGAGNAVTSKSCLRVEPRSFSINETAISSVNSTESERLRTTSGCTFDMLSGDVASQYDFLDLHSHCGAKLRGKFQRLMLALPSIFPSKTTHGCTKAGEVRVNMKGCVL